MPQGRRKTPFSGKLKKQQLLMKRQNKSEFLFFTKWSLTLLLHFDFISWRISAPRVPYFFLIACQCLSLNEFQCINYSMMCWGFHFFAMGTQTHIVDKEQRKRKKKLNRKLMNSRATWKRNATIWCQTAHRRALFRFRLFNSWNIGQKSSRKCINIFRITVFFFPFSFNYILILRARTDENRSESNSIRQENIGNVVHQNSNEPKWKRIEWNEMGTEKQ